MPDELVEVVMKDQKDQIVITIHETPEKELSLRSVDMLVPAMRVRLSTPTTDKIEQVFHQEVASWIRDICASATQPKQVINVPDFVMRFRGLAIRGYTLMVHTLSGGMRQFIVRLKRGVGNALALFRPNEQPGQGLNLFGEQPGSGFDREQGGSRLFDEMLSQLYLPLVNLNTYLQNSLSGEAGGHAAGLDQSLLLLKTKAEMLQFAFDRLISEVMLEKYAEGSDAEPKRPKLPQITYARDFPKQHRLA